jgi:hypothetical protein
VNVSDPHPAAGPELNHVRQSPVHLKDNTMYSLSRILMPIDFSERCLGGVRYAIPLAERFRSELTLLHVVPPIDYPSPEIRTINETRRRNWRTFSVLNSCILTFGE